MAAGVRAPLDAFGPHVVAADQQVLAGGLMAERLGVPWATSATTSAEFTDVLAGIPRVADWLDGLLRYLRSRIGDPSGTADPRFSPHLVPVFSTPEFVGPDARRDGQIRYVGPSIVDRPAGSDFPWD
ncbi:glycosyltransferase family protein [Streptomyces mirabilis]|uniref:hypothetical protein n=1 Tax=Streptomyces mirabilis TaxID=68239 RepID=UPI00367AEC6C